MKKKLALFLLPLLSTTSFALAMDESPDPQTIHASIRSNQSPLDDQAIVERIFKSPSLVLADYQALSLVSRTYHSIVGKVANKVHKKIQSQMEKLDGRIPTVIRTIFGRTVDCQHHIHYDPLNFMNFLRSNAQGDQVQRFLNSYTNLDDPNFDRRATTIAAHAHILFPEGMSADKRAYVTSRAFYKTAEEITARATTIATHAHILFPEGMSAYKRAYITSRAIDLTAEEITARATTVPPTPL